MRKDTYLRGTAIGDGTLKISVGSFKLMRRREWALQFTVEEKEVNREKLGHRITIRDLTLG
jgi:hypothetical protein